MSTSEYSAGGAYRGRRRKPGAQAARPAGIYPPVTGENAETAQTLTAAGSDRIALTAIVTPTAGQILTVRNNTGNSVTYSNSTLTIVKLA